MTTDTLPKYSLDNRETGCCPRFDPVPWDGEEFVFHERLFVLAKTVNFMHIPLNIGSVMKRTWQKILDAGGCTRRRMLGPLDGSVPVARRALLCCGP